jgi:hypothetical protein
MITANLDDYKCQFCNKVYKYKSGLSRHKKKCSNTELTIYQPKVPANTPENFIMEKHIDQLSEQNTNEKMESILEQLLVQQAEQAKQQAEQNKLIIELANKPTMQNSNSNSNNNNNNNNNNTFNLNTFLNVDCKDAMNIEDFIDSVNITIEDLKDIGTHGFLYSMDVAMMNKLKKMKQIERPIHCTDKKRKQFYIKKNNKWNKDCDQKEMYEIIKSINMIQRKLFVKWNEELTAQNPEWIKDTTFFSTVIDILDKINSLFGVTEDVQKLKKKLFSTIVEYTTIKKTKLNRQNIIYKQGVLVEE